MQKILHNMQNNLTMGSVGTSVWGTSSEGEVWHYEQTQRYIIVREAT